MSKEPIKRRALWSGRIQPECIEAIEAAGTRLKLSKGEVVELAVRRLETDESAIRTEMLGNARTRLSEADDILATLERGQV
jgi:hypothetical protein